MSILSIYEHWGSFHLLIPSSISFFKDSKFLSYRSFTCLVRVTPRYIIHGYCDHCFLDFFLSLFIICVQEGYCFLVSLVSSYFIEGVYQLQMISGRILWLFFLWFSCVRISRVCYSRIALLWGCHTVLTIAGCALTLVFRFLGFCVLGLGKLQLQVPIYKFIFVGRMFIPLVSVSYLVFLFEQPGVIVTHESSGPVGCFFLGFGSLHHF